MTKEAVETILSTTIVIGIAPVLVSVFASKEVWGITMGLWLAVITAQIVVHNTGRRIETGVSDESKS